MNFQTVISDLEIHVRQVVIIVCHCYYYHTTGRSAQILLHTWSEAT